MRALFCLLLLPTLLACDANDPLLPEQPFEAIVLELPRAADGSYDALASGGGMTLRFADGRIEGRYSPGRDDSGGEGPPTPFVSVTGTYELDESGVRLTTDALPAWFPRTLEWAGSVLTAEWRAAEGSFRVVLIAR